MYFNHQVYLNLYDTSYTLKNLNYVSGTLRSLSLIRCFDFQLQFIVGIIYGVSLFVYDCDFPRLFSIYMIFDVFLFLYLFLIFYNKTYNSKKKTQ